MLLLPGLLLIGATVALVVLGFSIVDEAWDDWQAERPRPHDQAHRVRKCSTTSTSSR